MSSVATFASERRMNAFIVTFYFVGFVTVLTLDWLVAFFMRHFFKTGSAVANSASEFRMDRIFQ
jgi:hypothetical protein